MVASTVPATPGIAQAVDGVPISIELAGLRNMRGFVLVCVTPNAAAFPDCTNDRAATRARVAAAQAGHMRLMVPGRGEYAIAVVHDEDGNGRLNTMLAIPREGFGFSRNPRLRMGPPRFPDASFTVTDQPVTQSVRLRYML